MPKTVLFLHGPLVPLHVPIPEWLFNVRLCDTWTGRLCSPLNRAPVQGTTQKMSFTTAVRNSKFQRQFFVPVVLFYTAPETVVPVPKVIPRCDTHLGETSIIQIIVTRELKIGCRRIF